MRSQTPPLAPGDDVTVHIVLNDFGPLGHRAPCLALHLCPLPPRRKKVFALRDILTEYSPPWVSVRLAVAGLHVRRGAGRTFRYRPRVGGDRLPHRLTFQLLICHLDRPLSNRGPDTAAISA